MASSPTINEQPRRSRRWAARALRGARQVLLQTASWTRLLALRAMYPGLHADRACFIGRDCDISVQRGGRLVLVGCHVSRGCTITAGPESTVIIEADYIGPYSTIVGRTSVTIGTGSKLAERSVVRDGNHDHSVPLREMRFTSSAVAIGKDVWVGAGAIVLSGVSVGDGVTIAAGAVVTADVRAGGTVAGVPAREIKRRQP